MQNTPMQTTLTVPKKNGRSAAPPMPKAEPAALADGSEQELMALRGEIAALGKVHPVIELNLDGTVITANENFLNALGYPLEEIKGQHHSMFVEPAYRASVEYRQFWARPQPRRVPGRANTSASARAARRSGFRRPTTRSSTATAGRSRW